MAATNNLARSVNSHRTILRPAGPQTLNFIIDPNHIEEGFIKGDMWVEQKRHIILASDYQMELLMNSTHWYIILLLILIIHVRLFDMNINLTYVACNFVGTFKLVKATFIQLWSSHAFVRHAVAKQISLVFILMSARRRVIMIISYLVGTTYSTKSILA